MLVNTKKNVMTNNLANNQYMKENSNSLKKAGRKVSSKSISHGSFHAVNFNTIN